LKESAGVLHRAKASEILLGMDEPVDIFFVDPPFQLDLWQETLNIIVARKLLKKGGYIYLECPKTQVIELDSRWFTVKDKAAGNLRIRLLQWSN
jgi:16S rRNA (guanine966-N2)-methyltransferase